MCLWVNPISTGLKMAEMVMSHGGDRLLGLVSSQNAGIL